MQQEIPHWVEGLFALADQLEERLAKARGHVEKLTLNALLSKPNGPSNVGSSPSRTICHRRWTC